MSKHLIEINFEQLKFNLYHLLNVSADASEKKIKKSYRTLIMKFHPDKHNIIDEDIYNHLTLANQILTNLDLRDKYDNWLKSFGEDGLSHSNLKDNFKKTLSDTKELFPSLPSEATKSYYDKNKNLNDKHGINENWDKESTLRKYNQKKKEVNLDIRQL